MKRTTLAIDEDLIPKIKVLMNKNNKSLRKTVNELIRAGFTNQRIQKEMKSKYKAPTFAMGLRTGIDPHKLNQFYDLLEMENYPK